VGFRHRRALLGGQQLDQAHRFVAQRVAHRAVAAARAIPGIERAAAERHLARLRQGRPESIETSALHLDILRDFKRINSHITSVAYPILEAAGALISTRLKQA